MAVSNVVGMDSAETLQGRGGEGDAGRATDVLHPLHLTNTPLEDTAERPQLEFSVLYLQHFTLLLSISVHTFKTRKSRSLHFSKVSFNLAIPAQYHVMIEQNI